MTGAPAPATTPATTPTPAAPWYQGLPDVTPEVVGHWQNKNWHSLTPEQIAINATIAHRNAEKYIGAPADQLLRLPTDASDEEGWAKVWQRLGAPANADGYDFSKVKSETGEVDKALLDTMRQTAAALKLPAEHAQRITAELVKHLDKQTQAKALDDTAAIEAERGTLQKNWGANFAANKTVAQNAAAALNVTPQEVAVLEKTLGYSKVMEMFRQIGSKIGEDRFVSNGSPGNVGVMTRDQAVATKADLMKDSDWVARYMKGGVAEQRQMLNLNKVIVG